MNRDCNTVLNMVDDARKPWDARLLERIQRSSGEARAGGKHKWTPRQRVVYGVFLTAWLSFLVATNGRHVEWWPFPAIIVVVAVTQLAMHLWEHRHRA